MQLFGLCRRDAPTIVTSIRINSTFINVLWEGRERDGPATAKYEPVLTLAQMLTRARLHTRR